jgi:hypothetical protein
MNNRQFIILLKKDDNTAKLNIIMCNTVELLFWE